MAIAGIFSILKDVVFPSIDKILVDKDKAKELKHNLEMAVLDMDRKELESATSIIIAEAGGEGFLQKNWRPITMLSMVVLLGAYYLGLAPPYLIENPELAEKLFSVIQVGLGGYVVGRSGEKMVETFQEPKRLEAEAKVIDAQGKNRKPTKLNS